MKDFHIHLSGGKCDSPEVFKQKTLEAGVSGGNVLSLHPLSCAEFADTDQRWRTRLESVLQFTAAAPGFRPIFRLDPTEADAEAQIAGAAAAGIAGFKIICTHFYPREVIKQLELIAETNLPVIFHSGILYDGNCSSKFNRPVEFECLMKIPRLRFSLAHVSWPWCGELVAIFGKFNYLAQQTGGNSPEVFLDLTPGTPPIFRRDALRQIYLAGYNIKERAVWGTDNFANDYNVEYAKYWAKLDRQLIAEIERDRELFCCPGADRRGYDSGLWEAVADLNCDRFFND